MVGRFERDDCFEHRQWRRISWRIGLACLAKDSAGLGNFFQLSILYLKNLCRLGDRHAWHCGGHVEQRALIQGRHEFAAEPQERENRRDKNDQRADERERSITQHEIDERLITPDQKSVHRIFRFGRDLSANEHRHQHRHERDAEE